MAGRVTNCRSHVRSFCSGGRERLLLLHCISACPCANSPEVLARAEVEVDSGPEESGALEDQTLDAFRGEFKQLFGRSRTIPTSALQPELRKQRLSTVSADKEDLNFERKILAVEKIKNVRSQDVLDLICRKIVRICE